MEVAILILLACLTGDDCNTKMEMHVNTTALKVTHSCHCEEIEGWGECHLALRIQETHFDHIKRCFQ